jgi:hypothetical protein
MSFLPPAEERCQPTYPELLRFFAPLALQAAAQSFTYPLVAMVASRGEGGPLNLAGLAQSNSVMFLLGTLGAGLITTGMVYGKSVEGYRRFCQVNYLLAAAVAVAQLLASIPAVSHLIFAGVVGLPPSIEGPASLTLLATVPLQFLFFLRNPYQVALYCCKATGLASTATVLRIALTVAIAPLFCAAHLVGPVWAVVCLTLPVAAEAVLSWHFARPYLAALVPQAAGKPPDVGELMGFTLPLSAGGFFLSVSGMVLGAMIARAPDPERMLPAYYLAGGLAGPVAFAASRMQAVVIAFPPGGRGNAVLRFTVVSGLTLGLLPLLFLLPWTSRLYYVGLQKCDPSMLGLVAASAIGLALNPLVVALRAYNEGRAALRKSTVLVLTGQGVFLGVMTSVAFVCLALHVTGNLIGPVANIVSNACAALAVAFALNWERRTDLPLPQRDESGANPLR